MSEQIEAKAVEILTQIQGAVQAAGGVAVEQLPEIAQSYILYGRVWETLQVCALFTLFVATTYFAYKCAKNLNQVDAPDICLPGVIFGGTFGASSLMATILESNDMLLVWLAPKVWLIQKLAEMVK